MTEKPKRPRDANQLAAHIVGLATGEDVEYKPDTSGQSKGGLKGGKARAAKLTKRQRSEASEKAARARWKAKASQSN